MRYFITPLRLQGKPIPKDELKAIKAFHGDVRMVMKESELGRISCVASIAPQMPGQRIPYPDLLDATIQWMTHKEMVISGLEVVEEVTYAQSWWCQAG